MSSSVSWPYISGSRVPSRLRLGPDRTKTTGSWDKGRAFGCEDARSPSMGCTAKAAGVGRSDTIQFFHGSEVAHWANADEPAASALQEVPGAPGTESILESTANRAGGLFSKPWQTAVGGETGTAK